MGQTYTLDIMLRELHIHASRLRYELFAELLARVARV